MSNMSYCRFRNTLTDLEDCWENIADNDVSADEDEARDKLIKLCKRISEYFDE
jgi:hypothetical protein